MVLIVSPSLKNTVWLGPLMRLIYQYRAFKYDNQDFVSTRCVAPFKNDAGSIGTYEFGAFRVLWQCPSVASHNIGDSGMRLEMKEGVRLDRQCFPSTMEYYIV